MEVAPNLRFKRTSVGLKNAYNFPNASANFQVRPQRTAGVLIQDQFADDDLIQSRRKHSTGDNPHFFMNLSANGQHSANGKVVQGVAGRHKYLLGEFARNKRSS